MAAEKSTTVISLPQMVDLALNSPEVGIVNFTVLHSLLHVIVNQLDLGDCNVEFRGSDSERLQNYIATAKPGPMITLTEYIIGPDGKGRKKRRGSKKKDSKRSSIDEKGKKDENQKEKEITIIKRDESLVEAASSHSFQTIVVVEPASREKLGDSPKFTIALTKEQLSKLQGDIKGIQKQVQELTELPANIGLIDALRSSGKVDKNSPVLDMFQILNLVKRLDATEVSINKLASMMEDIAKELSQGGGGRDPNQPPTVAFETPSKINEGPPAVDLVAKSQELRQSLDGSAGGGIQLSEICGQIKNLENRVEVLEKSPPMTSSERPSVTTKKPKKGGQVKPNTEDDDDKDEDETKDANDRPEGTMTEGDTDFASIDISQLPAREALQILQREIINLKEFYLGNDAGTQALKEIDEIKQALMSGQGMDAMPPDVKLGQIDLKVNDLKEQVHTLDTVYNQQFSNVHDKLDFLDNEIAALWERINLGMPAGDATNKADGQNVTELYNKLLQLQENMNAMSETAQKLLNEREGKQTTLDIMIEQIELLKTVKADREDLEDALADKADACQINRKVSHEQFDAAYDEISKALEDNLDKLKKQEELWMQSLNDLQKEIGNKLDKMELTPLKDFINSKLKTIQDKVKKISALKQEHEAAGTKSKFLRNVNCISCDADVVMKKQTDITLYPKPYASPPSKSPGPYLAYELDQLRKQQKSLPNSKNLNMFESALQSGRSKHSDKDHLCNRYCGGSHTTTTPQQRVMRVGHFMEQWGPEIAPVNEVLIRGTDGHLYKGRDDATLKAVAAEKGPTPRVETPAMVISEYNPNKDKEQVESKADMAMSTGSVSGLKNQEGRGSAGSQLRPKTSVDKPSAEGQNGKPTEKRRSSVKSADIK